MTTWHQNHGNLLLVFVAGIVFVAVSAIVYEQSRFVPPKFPPASAIDTDAALSHEVSGQESAQIEIIGSAAVNGLMRLMVYDSAERFGNPERATITASLAVDAGRATLDIDPSKLDRSVSIFAFHDEDENGTLTVSPQGVPLERYGYSGAVRYDGPNRSPTFDQTSIDRPDPGETIQLFIR